MDNTPLNSASILAIAIACHMANRAYCASLGDDSQKIWEDAPEWQKSSAIKGVEFHLSNSDAGPSASHDSWMAQKVADGWVYGEVKDEEKKTHPCIVPFDQLPKEQQFKDVLFGLIVTSMHPFVQDAQTLENSLSNVKDANAPLIAERDELAGTVAKLDAANKELFDQLDKAKAELSNRDSAAVTSKARGARKLRKASFAAAEKAALVRTEQGVGLRDILLLAAKADGDAFEIVASDGKGELACFSPVVVAGNAWQSHPSGVVLSQPITLKGPSAPAASPPIAGFALFDQGGTQIAWARTASPVVVPNDQEMRFDALLFS